MASILLANVLFKPNIGGVENSILEIANILIDSDNKVDIVCSNRNNETDTNLVPFEQLNGFNIYRYNYTFGKLSFIYNLLNSIQLLRKLKRDNTYDFVVSRNYLLVIASNVAGFCNIKYIPPEVTYYSSKNSVSKGGLKNYINHYFKNFLESLALYLADEIFVFSDTMVDQVKKVSFGLVAVKKVEPGVNLKKFSPPKSNEKNKLRALYGIPKNKKVLLALGRYSEIKQYDLAVLSMKYLDDSFLLLLVGSGPELDNYRSIISKYYLDSKVRILDSTKNPEDFYKISDAFLMTSRYESFGQTILEAAATQLKIIAFGKESGVSTNVESMLSEYSQLYTVNEQSALKLSNKVLAAFSNSNNSTTILSKSGISLSERYSWKQFIKNIGIPL